MLRGLHTVMQPVGKLRPKCVSSMNAETSDTPVQITYPTNVGQSTFHKLHLHQFQQTKRSQEIHFWCLKITRRFNTIVKQLSLSHSQSTFAAKWHTQTWTEEVTHPLSDWKRLALAFNRRWSEDFSLSFIHDNVRVELPLTRTSSHSDSEPHHSLNFELTTSESNVLFPSQKRPVCKCNTSSDWSIELQRFAYHMLQK